MTRVSVIVTVLNEGESISRLLDSLECQSHRPDEIVIVDGGSDDETLETIERYRECLPLRLLHQPGSNISQGRNAAIAAATGEIIAATDAGVYLAKDWLRELIAPFENTRYAPDVVCGFFIADPQTPFEVAMGATVLPDLDEIDPAHFLPSSRSVAFRKRAWEQVGGYPEWLDYCEDLIFDLELKRAGFRFTFAPRAVAYFRPRSSLPAFFRQYYRYARGDGKANLWARRHCIRYGSYLAGLALALAGRRWPIAWIGLVTGGLAYLARPYLRLVRAIRRRPRTDQSGQVLGLVALVPIIRLTGDIAKMAGYPVGLWWRLRRSR